MKHPPPPPPVPCTMEVEVTLLLHWKNNIQVLTNYNLTSDGGPAEDSSTIKNKIFIHCVLQLILLGDQICVVCCITRIPFSTVNYQKQYTLLQILILTVVERATNNYISPLHKCPDIFGDI